MANLDLTQKVILQLLFKWGMLNMVFILSGCLIFFNILQTSDNFLWPSKSTMFSHILSQYWFFCVLYLIFNFLPSLLYSILESALSSESQFSYLLSSSLMNAFISSLNHASYPFLSFLPNDSKAAYEYFFYISVLLIYCTFFLQM